MRSNTDYTSQAKFWDRDRPRVMGDFIARPKVLEIISRSIPSSVKFVDLDDNASTIESEIKARIYEAGCGNGYFSRMLLEKGYHVISADNNEEMIKRFERKNAVMGLKDVEVYNWDITKTPFNLGVKGITAIGVLQHLDSYQLFNVLSIFAKNLVQFGQIFLQVPHPSLAIPGSPARNRNPNWFKLNPLVSEEDDSKFSYVLRDVQGNKFKGELWNHQTSRYINMLSDLGFRIEGMTEPIVEKRDLKHLSWGREYGYPAYLIIRARKEGR